ncbi:MAG TPA: glycosyltransferase, partial [Candidatus Pacearchaeota archaeon]|nr:glycosyltransferase [Candidatus Pacearchaeota archaeon]
MKLLAIPNDPTSAYHRNSRKDFLSEFNPNGFFDGVAFLNWKDDSDTEYCGVDSFNILKDKRGARDLMDRLIRGDVAFDYPLFTDIFSKEKDRIIGLARDFNPDMVRAFNTHFAAELGIMVSQALDVPLLVSAHDIERLTSAVERADYLACVSDVVRDRCVAGYGIDPENVGVIPDGIDMNWFYPRSETEIRGAFSGMSARNKLFSVGRLVPGKNLEILLKSVQIVERELGGVMHFHVGKGTPESREEIEYLKQNLGLEGVSYFLGGMQKDQLPFYYSWADVYALPTLHEGLGRASIEALACGTPVVTTNYAPMTEVVQDGYNGLTSDPRD